MLEAPELEDNGENMGGDEGGVSRRGGVDISVSTCSWSRSSTIDTAMLWIVGGTVYPSAKPIICVTCRGGVRHQMRLQNEGE
jgi:hypothetical protein